MFDDNSPLTAEVAEEVAMELEREGYFDKLYKKAFPNGIPASKSSVVSSVSNEGDGREQ